MSLDYKTYLLICLAEECAEVTQLASKCIRFGTENIAPGQTVVNRNRLAGELNDLLGVLEALEQEGVKLDVPNKEAIAAKVDKIRRMYEYHG